MSLLLWQINNSSAPPNFGAPTSIPAKQNSTPQRAVVEYVTGRGFYTQLPTATATQPLIGKIGNVPQYPYLIGLDQTESNIVPVSAMVADATQSLTTELSFDLPQLVLDPTDNATLLLVPNVFLAPAVNGLVIASVQIAPQALLNGQWVNATTLQGGLTYSSWRCQVTISVVAVAATAATTLNVSAYALLTVLPQ